jgi:hypothetical protein
MVAVLSGELKISYPMAGGRWHMARGRWYVGRAKRPEAAEQKALDEAYLHM